MKTTSKLITQVHKKKVLYLKADLPTGKFFDVLKTNLKSEFTHRPSILPQLPQLLSKALQRVNILLCSKDKNKSIQVTFFDVLEMNLMSELIIILRFCPSYPLRRPRG